MVDFSEKAGAEKQALLGSLDPSLPLKPDFQVQDGAVIRATTSTHPQRYQNRWRRIKSMASIFTLGTLTVAALLYHSAPGGSSHLFHFLTNQHAHWSTYAMDQQVKGYFEGPALLYSIKRRELQLFNQYMNSMLTVCSWRFRDQCQEEELMPVLRVCACSVGNLVQSVARLQKHRPMH